MILEGANPIDDFDENGKQAATACRRAFMYVIPL